MSHADRVECVACGGSGLKSRPGDGADPACVPCKGTGSILLTQEVTVQADEPPPAGGEPPGLELLPTVTVQHSSESVEHYTPHPYVEAARATLGEIDLDPASCELAQEQVQAAAWYGPGSPFGDNGLAEPWLGRVFLNPPGGRVPPECQGMGTSSNAALWWATLAEAWRTGEVEAAIFVGFTLEILRSAQALDTLQPLDFPFCVPSSRISFDTHNRKIEKGKCRGELIDPSKPVGARVEQDSPGHANVIVFLPPVIKGASPDPRAVDERAVEGFRMLFRPFGRCRV